MSLESIFSELKEAEAKAGYINPLATIDLARYVQFKRTGKGFPHWSKALSGMYDAVLEQIKVSTEKEVSS